MRFGLVGLPAQVVHALVEYAAQSVKTADHIFGLAHELAVALQDRDIALLFALLLGGEVGGAHTPGVLVADAVDLGIDGLVDGLAAKRGLDRFEGAQQKLHQGVLFDDLRGFHADGVDQQAQHGETLVELGLFGLGDHVLGGGAVEDLLDLVVAAVLLEQVVVDGKAFGDLLVLDILADQRLVHRQILLFIGLDDAAQVHPAAGGDKGLALHAGLDAVEILMLGVQITDD